MDLLTISIIIFFLLWFRSVLFPKPAPKKSVEKELGEAIGKYLEKGIQINVKIEGEQKKD